MGSALRDVYAQAAVSQDLSQRPGACDADVLLAAGFVARRFRRGMIGLVLWRLSSTADRTGMAEMIAEATNWLVARVQAGKLRRINRTEAMSIAQATLRWFVGDRCAECDGRGFRLIPGTQRTSEKTCAACRGTTMPDVHEIDPPHTEHVEWLIGELNSLQGFIRSEIARAMA